MYSETSPRISFSDDLSQEDEIQIEHESRQDTSLLEDSNSEFEFSLCSSLDHEPSLADDLFADGMILPVQIQDSSVVPIKQANRYKPPRRSSLLPPLPIPTNENPTKDQTKKEVLLLANPDQVEEKPAQSKSFWGFKRSSSLNCDIGKSLISSLPLLSRSKSTGSVPNPKPTSSKDTQRRSSNRQRSNSTPKSSSSSGSPYVYSLPQQKPSLKKNYGGPHGNGVWISPVLNVPPPYISKGTANLLGLGSFLKNAKEKKIRK